MKVRQSVESAEHDTGIAGQRDSSGGTSTQPLAPHAWQIQIRLAKIVLINSRIRGTRNQNDLGIIGWQS